MPLGPSLLGAAYFTGIKLAGYSAAGMYLNRKERLDRPHPALFGVARTALGVAVGVSYGLTAARLDLPNGTFLWYLGLVPLRVLEWLATLWLFYRTSASVNSHRPWYVTLGVGWSFALDLPALMAAFILPGGFWIC